MAKKKTQPYSPKHRYSKTRVCPPGHHWNGKTCVVTQRKVDPGPVTTPAPAAASGSDLQPIAGTITPGGASGAPVAPGGGDLTSTAGSSGIGALFADAVFGSGAGPAPQYNYQDQYANAQAQQISDQSETTGGPG